jgi:hypothetical protein
MVVPAKAGTHNHRCSLLPWMPLQLSPNKRRWLWVPARASLGRDDVDYFVNSAKAPLQSSGGGFF